MLFPSAIFLVPAIATLLPAVVTATAATQLILQESRILNPDLTVSDFDLWYNKNVLPEFMARTNASLGVRYTLVAGSNNSFARGYQHVALYKIPVTSLNGTGYEAFPSPSADKGDIGPTDVEMVVSTWNPIQVFQGLREKRGQVPAGRPKVACIVKIEPRVGGDDEVEEWYHKQHLDMLSMLPTYRRSTRYRSSDGSKPRWLAIHELDSAYVEPYLGEVLMGTELATSVMNGIQTFEAANWDFVFESGSEKL